MKIISSLRRTVIFTLLLIEFLDEKDVHALRYGFRPDETSVCSSASTVAKTDYLMYHPSYGPSC